MSKSAPHDECPLDDGFSELNQESNAGFGCHPIRHLTASDGEQVRKAREVALQQDAMNYDRLHRAVRHSVAGGEAARLQVALSRNVPPPPAFPPLAAPNRRTVEATRARLMRRRTVATVGGYLSEPRTSPRPSYSDTSSRTSTEPVTPRRPLDLLDPKASTPMSAGGKATAEAEAAELHREGCELLGEAVAEELLEKALLIREAVGHGGEDMRHASTQLRLGQALLLDSAKGPGRFPRAVALLEQAQAALADGALGREEEAELASALDSGAFAQLQSFLWCASWKAPSEAGLLRSLKLKERIYGPEHMECARTLHALGVIYGRLGESSKAEEALSRSAAAFENLFGPDSEELTEVLESLAKARMHLGHCDEARDLVQRSLAIRRQARDLGKDDHTAFAASEARLGRMYLVLGQHDQARECLRRSVMVAASAIATEDGDPVEVAVPRLLREAELRLSLGEAERAKEVLMHAHQLLHDFLIRQRCEEQTVPLKTANDILALRFASVEAALGNVDVATEWCRCAAQHVGDNWHATLQLAVARQACGDVSEAELCLRAAISECTLKATPTAVQQAIAVQARAWVMINRCDVAKWLDDAVVQQP